MNELKQAIDMILKDNPIKIIFSNPIDKTGDVKKIDIRSKESMYHVTKHTATQVFHENITDIKEYVLQQFAVFKQGSFFTDNYTYSVKISKKGKVLVSKTKAENTNSTNNTHNRQKNYILQEGMDIPALRDIGVFTPDGRVVKAMYSKYRQINRFLEIVDDAIRDREYKTLSILDFGCGKSYLTFILYYYLTELRDIDVHMIGLDLKEDVIQNCNIIAKKYAYDSLRFEVGDINTYQADKKIDMVISLHACDLATDYALYNAVKWNAKMIFAVPCCQHEVNKQINTEDLGILTRYGLIKERVSSLMTDAIRANMLTYSGYKTQIIEFVDFEHSPKNILIRAVKAKISEKKKQDALAEVQRLSETFGVEQKLYQLLSEVNSNKVNLN
ncbi:MAG: SAM-dependent methyltransferase [Clostridiales bacterium]|nr:SAM-dependent methyltransferase [Clostridiales bacterium]